MDVVLLDSLGDDGLSRLFRRQVASDEGRADEGWAGEAMMKVG